MRFAECFIALSTTSAVSRCNVEAARCPPFPTSMTEYSSEFQQPEPPTVAPEFQTHFVQHKWNQNLSHIQIGYMYNSPGSNLVRVDETYKGALASSIFDFSNVTQDGLVDNKLTIFSADLTHPDVYRGYVNSNYPLISPEFLVVGAAVFSGLVQRQFLPEKVASWSLFYQGTIPVTVYVDGCNVVQGYDYFYPVERTRVTTSFLNTRVGEVDI